MSKITNILGLIEKINELKEQLKKQIVSLPDNPRINRLAPNCFTISSKDLGNNWSVAYHDFPQQYALLVKIIDRTDPAKIEEKLQEIISKKMVIENKLTVKFHPDVIEHISKLL